MCAFNYRFVPGGAAGARDDRGRRDRRDPPLPRLLPAGLGRRPTEAVWRFDKDAAGSGALGDLGAHVIDLARYLVGEIDAVSRARRATFQPGREVDDAFEAVGGLRGRRGRDDRGDALRHRAQERAYAGRSTARKGSIALRPRAPQRAAGPPRRHHAGRVGAGLPDRARHRGRPPVLGALVAAGPHHRLGAHLRARAAPPADRDPRRRRRRPARRDARGRLPRRRGVRRDRALGASRARARRVPYRD